MSLRTLAGDARLPLRAFVATVRRWGGNRHPVRSATASDDTDDTN